MSCNIVLLSSLPSHSLIYPVTRETNLTNFFHLQKNYAVEFSFLFRFTILILITFIWNICNCCRKKFLSSSYPHSLLFSFPQSSSSSADAPPPIRTFQLHPLTHTAARSVRYSIGCRQPSFPLLRIVIITKQTPWPLVRERTIPTERRPLVGEI
jgi:hypothetical protein